MTKSSISPVFYLLFYISTIYVFLIFLNLNNNNFYNDLGITYFVKLFFREKCHQLIKKKNVFL